MPRVPDIPCESSRCPTRGSSGEERSGIDRQFQKENESLMELVVERGNVIKALKRV